MATYLLGGITFANKEAVSAYWQAVHALAYAATPAGETRMDATAGEGDGCQCDDDKGER